MSVVKLEYSRENDAQTCPVRYRRQLGVTDEYVSVSLLERELRRSPALAKDILQWISYGSVPSHAEAWAQRLRGEVEEILAEPLTR